MPADFGYSSPATPGPIAAAAPSHIDRNALRQSDQQADECYRLIDDMHEAKAILEKDVTEKDQELGGLFEQQRQHCEETERADSELKRHESKLVESLSELEREYGEGMRRLRREYGSSVSGMERSIASGWEKGDHLQELSRSLESEEEVGLPRAEAEYQQSIGTPREAECKEALQEKQEELERLKNLVEDHSGVWDEAVELRRDYAEQTGLVNAEHRHWIKYWEERKLLLDRNYYTSGLNARYEATQDDRNRSHERLSDLKDALRAYEEEIELIEEAKSQYDDVRRRMDHIMDSERPAHDPVGSAKTVSEVLELKRIADTTREKLCLASQELRQGLKGTGIREVHPQSPWKRGNELGYLEYLTGQAINLDAARYHEEVARNEGYWVNVLKGVEKSCDITVDFLADHTGAQWLQAAYLFGKGAVPAFFHSDPKSAVRGAVDPFAEAAIDVLLDTTRDKSAGFLDLLDWRSGPGGLAEWQWGAAKSLIQNLGIDYFKDWGYEQVGLKDPED